MTAVLTRSHSLRHMSSHLRKQIILALGPWALRRFQRFYVIRDDTRRYASNTSLPLAGQPSVWLKPDSRSSWEEGQTNKKTGDSAFSHTLYGMKVQIDPSKTIESIQDKERGAGRIFLTTPEKDKLRALGFFFFSGTRGHFWLRYFPRSTPHHLHHYQRCPLDYRYLDAFPLFFFPLCWLGFLSALYHFLSPSLLLYDS